MINMSVKYIVEGSKGSGKSTLCKMIKQKHKDQFVHYHHFHSTHLLDMNEMYKHRYDDNLHVYDRGYLSYLIYGWVQDYHQTFETYVDHDTITLKSWSPLSRKHFVEMINNLDDDGKMIIFYASDVSILFDRLNKRLKDTGKYATDDELDALEMSNELYRAYGHILQSMERIENKKNGTNHQKVVTFDICSDEDIQQLI